MVVWYDPAGRRTYDLPSYPCERRTRYQLSQPDTVCDEEQVTEMSNIPLCNEQMEIGLGSRESHFINFLAIERLLDFHALNTRNIARSNIAIR